MNTLQKDWLTQGWIDFEYKKFVIMAYLQEARQHFSDKKFYPTLPELHDHYESAAQFQSRKGTLSASFPKELTGIDPKSLAGQYKPKDEPEGYIQEIDAIMDFALPRFEQTLTEGQRMAREIEADLSLKPIGMLPLRRDEGYLFVHWTANPETHIYYFGLTLYAGFTGQTGGKRIIRTRYIESVRKGVGQTFETLKLELIRRQPNLPNPATFMVESKRQLPLQETLLPMASRLIEDQVK